MPNPIETEKIRECFHLELGLKGAGFYRTFRTLIDKMDMDWREDWRRRDEERRKEDEIKMNMRSTSRR